MGKIIVVLMMLWVPLYLSADPTAVSIVIDETVEVVTSNAESQVGGKPAVIGEDRVPRFEGRSPPQVPSRQQKLVFYPCSQCHRYWKTNPVPHELAPVHRVGLNHGQNRFWCLTCHDDEDRDFLHTERDGKVGFNESWRICGQCHANRQQDWYFGAHGKRVNGWQGEPVRYNCTHCHDPHFPPFEKRQPQPKPPVRVGLEPMKKPLRQHQPIWERHGTNTQEVQHD